MEVNELRLGNFIQAEDDTLFMYCNAEVIALSKNYLTNYKTVSWKSIQKENLGHSQDDNVIDIEGIPLTQEWLERFGFEKAKWNQGLYELFADTPNSHFEIAEVGDIFQFNKRFGMDDSPLNIVKIKYVHEFQNIYFALINTELTVK